jgi:hypothetical protein
MDGTLGPWNFLHFINHATGDSMFYTADFLDLIYHIVVEFYMNVELYFFLAVLGFELRPSHLLGRHHAFSAFSSADFRDKILLFA